ncbi:MAG: nucleoside hydrolase [Candidatus Bipolaricaulia bacterium]
MIHRLIIDTDTATDDALALLMALSWPDTQVEAVTIVAGNVNFDQQVENALYTIELAGMGGEVPVYPGSRQPLMRPLVSVPEVHGEDGMGNSSYPQAKQRPESQHAVDALIERITAAPGEITLVAIGPLTNIAMALHREPAIAKQVREVYIMGGTNQALGNITPATEYNIWVDPEAAKIVFHSGMSMTMVGWEICTRHAFFDEAEQTRIREMDTPKARFFTEINRVIVEFNRVRHGIGGTTHPDSITVVIALDPTVATDVRERHVDVETKGELTQGMTVVDDLGVLGKAPNLKVCYAADGDRFREHFFRMLASV